LAPLVKGDVMLSAALNEAQNECPSTPLTQATASGDGFALSGTKICVPFAEQSERVLLTAKVGSDVGVFLLDPKAAGVSLTRQISTTREPWYEIVLDGAIVAASDVIMTAGGAEAAQWIMHRTITAYCAMQLGVTEAMTKTTAEFTCERVQFDVPIGSFQAVQHRAADCFIDSQCLKLVTYQAASMLDSGSEATNEVIIAKIWAGDTGHRVSYAAQHLHGGTGIDKDYHLWRFCLWARQIEVVLGNSSQLLADLGKRIAEGEAFAV
jgi:alkylation response protein AidB-like acyl-CoA dehydrogenase